MDFKTVLAAGALAFVATAASAQNVTASNPQSIMDYYFNEGVPARLGRDTVDDPMITVRQSGSEYTIFFYDCTGGADCGSIQFYSGYNADGSVSMQMVNQWNTDRRYSRAYVLDDGVTKLEYDVYMGGQGMDAVDFASVVALWVEEFEGFEATIGW
ncbi:YbjN domain-containing protein [Aliiroseovarius sp.]|uniref:YbjN domain-containing protein n=1 Tax=Aliiroseovarius sp. TaxID=1872442 RepID=UPI00262DF968|nr:YbjN domain-containing protein [Aliiroseovarius sp.]